MGVGFCLALRDWCIENNIGSCPNKSFKRILLTECEASMERDLGTPAQANPVDAKQRSVLLGSARFLGELVANGLAGGPLMLTVAEEFLGKSSRLMALEMLAVFLSICAPSFDRPTWKRHTDLERIFH